VKGFSFLLLNFPFESRLLRMSEKARISLLGIRVARVNKCILSTKFEQVYFVRFRKSKTGSVGAPGEI